MFSQKKVKLSKEELMTKMEALQKRYDRLFVDNNSVKENVVDLNSTISKKQGEIENLEAYVNTLTIETEKSSVKIQELETARDALDKALEESTQSLSAKSEELSEMQSQYNTEKRRLEDELCAFKIENEILNERLQNEKGERATLCLKITSLENTILSLNNTISIKQEEIGKLEACVTTLTMDIEKSSAKIQGLEISKDASDRALCESIQSLSTGSKMLQEAQSQYNAEKKRLENELNAFRKQIEILNEKLQKEKKEKEVKQKEDEEIKRKEAEEIKRKEEEEIKRNKEEEDKLTEEEKGVRRSVLPRNKTPGVESSSAVFTPITCTKSICKYMVRAGESCYYYGLDINKYNVLAVVDDYHSVYLYLETNRREEKLCTCQYDVRCLAWNQQGTLLAIGGAHNNNTNNTIQVWDIPNRKITKRLKIKDNNQDCNCLDWNGDTITAGTDKYIYHWNINDQDNDQDLQRNEALLPRNTIPSKYDSNIMTVQWSNCKSKLAMITCAGDMCIYNEEFKLIHHNKAHHGDSDPLLQWCPWDDQVIATCCKKGYLKIWRVQQDITLIKEVKHESEIANVKWIPSKKAVITAHQRNQLVLWEYPNLNVIRNMNGHMDTPCYLALNADKSTMVSKSNKEMIFWKPFV